MEQIFEPIVLRAASRPTAFRRFLFGPWPIVFAFLISSLAIYSRHNDLPFYYEKDAFTKAHQVVSGERNFLHPQLMLNTADVLLTLSGAERTAQNAVVAGRIAVALFSSISVAALVMLGWRITGYSGAMVAGTLLVGLPLLFELSHIFKEDTALLLGLSLSFLSMHIFWERRGRYEAGWMGAATAIAVSGKYIGVTAVVMALLLLFLLWRQAGNGGRWTAFLISMLLTFGVVNYQLIANGEDFIFGFKAEMAHLTRTDKIDDIPQFRKVGQTLSKTVPPGIAIAYLVFALHTTIYRRRDPIRWMLVVYPIAVICALLFSTRLFTRYFLPILVVLNFAAAMGIATLIRGAGKRMRMPERFIASIAIILAAIIVIRDYSQEWSAQFQSLAHPTRETFISEAIYRLLPDAVIASDFRVYLVSSDGNPRYYLPVEQKVIVANRIADFGSLDRLRELGVTHIALHGIDSRYLFLEVGKEPSQQARRRVKKQKYSPGIYDEIHEQTELVYSIKGYGSTYHAPDLRLYKILTK